MSRNVTRHRVTTYVIDIVTANCECHDVTQEEFLERMKNRVTLRNIRTWTA